ncbi:hypothetical protein pEaSNUABM40_00231 [Erwinia phage pEa_SNUABM_40]|uniref:Uncharacterized protein n=1 Tax=Erwinia phage pEa_SNUABM_3 TaxID=2869552 RepID=A0AAE8BYU4_9CAUD|nr:hypothetical protein MPK68_gp228 [Erwinia phage pEa_SNUABM_3]QZE56763.1 hypothetical protein pEaSNUABM20_00227 [Erwinia phage pEa_SNUABM_20]QZE58447.1 hypothetical protein pEaSNUABM40_00231 [Erwinia phage pEa_SNUABM_40]UAW53008.1 hypothetical protein pEaSNUABM23_00226 [Erwinia phage pEa_SNUABM_23]UIW10904.1 hypothetical protein pEaSNUABM23_00226 [Erwinia phage pEa_SNUABM_31]QZE56425.1 hypothetical protein pEaSNUABM3_00228 [Erwinia phage pEa_SNUABM_3]
MALKYRTQYKQHSIEDLRKRNLRRMQRLINRIKVEPRIVKPGEGVAFLDRMRQQQK